MITPKNCILLTLITITPDGGASRKVICGNAGVIKRSSNMILRDPFTLEEFNQTTRRATINYSDDHETLDVVLNNKPLDQNTVELLSTVMDIQTAILNGDGDCASKSTKHLLKLLNPRAPGKTCVCCNGTGKAMNKECEIETCIWCHGTGER